MSFRSVVSNGRSLENGVLGFSMFDVPLYRETFPYAMLLSLKD
jgi:hypothetical protein